MRLPVSQAPPVAERHCLRSDPRIPLGQRQLRRGDVDGSDPAGPWPRACLTAAFFQHTLPRSSAPGRTAYTPVFRHPDRPNRPRAFAASVRTSKRCGTACAKCSRHRRGPLYGGMPHDTQAGWWSWYLRRQAKRPPLPAAGCRTRAASVRRGLARYGDPRCAATGLLRGSSGLGIDEALAG